jgi:hypothetical protein
MPDSNRASSRAQSEGAPQEAERDAKAGYEMRNIEHLRGLRGVAAESPGEKKDMNIPEKVRKPTTLVAQLRASLKIKLAEGKIIHIG